MLRPWADDHLPSPGSVAVTVIILTHDEAANIERCLDTVGWASQVLVVDSGSTDGTVDLVSRRGVEVLEHDFEDFAAQRRWALTHETVSNDWVFLVDADEWVSAALAQEIASVVADSAYDAYMLRFRLVFQGRWIRHAGWYRGSWVVRLVLRHRATVRGAMNERVHVPGPVGKLVNDIVDEDCKPFARWVDKHNRYSTLQAKERSVLRRIPLGQRLRDAFNARPRRRIPREVLKAAVLPHVPLVGFFAFVYLYIVRFGFLDGREGLWFCWLQATQQLHIAIKMREQRWSREDAEPPP